MHDRWAFLDPILLRMRSRLEHLDEVMPSRRLLEGMLRSAMVDPTARLLREAELENAGCRQTITIGPYAVIRGQISALRSEARIEVGDHSFLGVGSRVWAQNRVRIGSYVLIAHLVDIHDSNAHSTNWRDRREDARSLFERNEPLDWSKVASAPVFIEDDVWIGFKSSVLKGVTVGRGAIVAACSVVTKDVPPFTLVAGNPARVVRELEASLGEDPSPKGSATGQATENAP